ncbi:MAG: DJ-1/PfpI family protein [Sumerlaeia bacterium]
MKILLMTGDAAEALEVMYPLQRLQEAGLDPVVAAPKAKVLRTVVHDFEPGFDTYTEKGGYRVEATLAFADARAVDFAGLVIPGGRAPEWIRNDADCLRLAREFFEAGKPVASICHGQLILSAANLIGGRTLTAYPALKPDMERAGATFLDREVVVDGELVTSRAWPDHPAFLREFLKLLGV